MSVASSGTIFVVGVGRSGTSLLHALISTSDDPCILQETGLIRRRGLRKTLGELQSDRRFYRNRELYNSFDPTTSLKNFYISLMQQYSFVIDKDPGLITHMAEVASELESVTFIHILRNPVDVIESKKRALWSKGRTFGVYALIHAIQLLSAREAKGSGISVIEIFYEDLLANPSYEMSKIGQSMQISFDDKKLECHGEYSRVKVFSDEEQWKRQVNTDITRYKRNDSSTLTDMQKLILANLMSRLGYARYSSAAQENKGIFANSVAWGGAVILIILAKAFNILNVKKIL